MPPVIPQNPLDAHPKWLLHLPRLAFILFLSVVIALLWLSHRSAREEQRTVMISDMLWLEQDLQFQLEHNEDLLEKLGHPDLSRSHFEDGAKALLNNQAGLRRILRFDRNGHLNEAVPAAAEIPELDQYWQLAVSRTRPVYGSPRLEISNEWLVDVYVPSFSDGQLTGLVVASYGLQKVLTDAVPWWLSEKYQIRIINFGGDVLASRSKIDTPPNDRTYQMAYDPPGRGLYLQATPYGNPIPWAPSLLSISLVALALTVLWSLWALRRHIHRRHQAEAALREEHAFRKAMEDSLDTGLRARDLSGRITHVNPAFCRMVGWRAEELIGRLPPMPYWVSEEIEATRALHDRILAGEGPEHGFEINFRRKNGEIFTALIHEAPLIDADGRQTGWMSSVVDVTEAKKAAERERQQQERLQSASRLIAMGEMASSLAHELNQPLAAIASYNTGCLNMLAADQGNLRDIEQALQKSSDQAQRAGRIIRRIYDFARRAEPKYEAISPNEWLEEIISFVSPDARRQGISLDTQITSSLPEFQGDRILLSQTLLNLLRNAIEAVAEKAEGNRLIILKAQKVNEALHVSVTDNGCGIDENSASRLFEPFFTTKTEGMGMGLAICRSVVEGHHGRLWHEANPQGGTTFNLLLPVKP